MAEQQPPPPHHRHHHDLNALGYNALHALYHPALAEVDAAEAAVPRIEADVAAARKLLAQKRAAFHPIQQAFLTNRERAMPTDCYQVIASYLDRLSRVRLAECDHHLHDYAIYGGNSGAAVWREGDELEKVYIRDGLAMTPLLHASRVDAVLPVRTLLVAKADVEARVGRGETPLHWASEGGHAALVTVLLDAHADVNCTDWNRKTALHRAANFFGADVIPMFINAGANINQRDNDGGNTPLQHACGRGNYNAVTALLAAGADVNIVSNNGWSPLCVHASVVLVILSPPYWRRVLMCIKGRGFSNALSLSRRRRHEAIIAMLLAAGAN